MASGNGQHVLAVIGATGHQGGSVVDFVLNDPELSKTHKIMALTRDPSKPAAKKLAERGAEVVKCDLEDSHQLKKVLDGADIMYAMTAMAAGGPSELEVGKRLADAAHDAGIKHLIYSTLPNASKISNGKYKVPHFDDKAATEDYIRQSQVPHTFFCPGFFMENFLTMMAPQPKGDGTYVVQGRAKPETKIPMISATVDTGNYVGAILANPDKYLGTVVVGSCGCLSMDEVVKTMSEVTGKTVTYEQISKEEYLPSLPKEFREDLINMFAYYDEFGFFGDLTSEAVAEAEKKPRKPVLSLKEFLQKNPLSLN
ncbi:hypothetical protein TRICI_001237 [Trichomonascus ciferrii]|uniref:NmrA-like domain-containing protein n=1 Tax=Trichomonascus ciferrii TaxID=44093 RepID=A0A642V9W1_9ASCO|nr:hypothetical protein TRICI_001237 [Trichomonascus ciferrii]